MSKIKIGAQVTAKARPTKVTVSGTFQGYELEDQEDPTSICGKVFYVKDGKQYLAHVYVDSIEVCESEDERTRRELLNFIEAEKEHSPETVPGKHWDRWITYLEKQKEQKPIPKFKVGDHIYDKKDSYNRNVIREVGKDYYINAFAQKMDMAYTDANFEFLEHLDYSLTPNKTAEWSEKDSSMLCDIVGYITGAGSSSGITKQERVDFLYGLPKRFNLQLKQEWDERDKEMLEKVLECIRFAEDRYQLEEEQMNGISVRLWLLEHINPQPHWKPSEEQMDALEKAWLECDSKETSAVLSSLMSDLQKLL